MKIGIVGASEEKWSNIQKAQVKVTINRILDTREDDVELGGPIVRGIGDEPIIMVSGGCPKGGADIWAEEEADKLGIQKEIYYAEVNQWESVFCATSESCKVSAPLADLGGHHHIGFKERNVQIAEAVDILYVISPKCKSCDGKGYTEHPEQNTINPLDGMTFWQRPCVKCKSTGRVWNGGEFTGLHAEKIGKKVVRIAV